MEIRATQEGNGTVISLKGSLTAVTALEFEACYMDRISKGENNFLIEFTDLDYISSAGLGSILTLCKKLKGTQGKVCLVGLHGTVKQVFEVSGVLSFFKVFASAEAALKEI